MRKSVSKRIKVSKTGKLMRRQIAVDHFLSKRRGSKTRLKRAQRTIDQGYEKKIKSYLTAR